MFGFSAGELMILLIVGIVVVGPKRLPEMMRKAGQYVAKLRRLSTDLRAQSGIDRILREEGLEKEIRELRALRESLSKHALFDSLVAAANKPAPSPARVASGGPARALPAAATPPKTLTPETGDASEAAAPAVATASDGSETTSAAANLVKPAPGAIARGAAISPARPANREPYRSFREREYPSYGPDHYEAFPDDLDETENEADLAEEPAANAPTTEVTAPPPAEPREIPSAKESSP